LSQHLTGRSANRGACAQPCRNRYDLEDASGRVIVSDQHLLSLKDLRLDDHLGTLMDVGITSFKIEGRLKNSSYIKNVVAHYRQRLDAIFTEHNASSSPPWEKSSLGQTACTFEPDPERTFSRGYTLYNIVDTRNKEATMSYGKARGQEIGTIALSGTHFVVTLNSHIQLNAGDGICYFNHKGELTGSVINAIAPTSRANQWITTLQSAEPVGTDNTLYRTYDHIFEKAMTNPHSVKRMIDVALCVEIRAQCVVLQAQIPDGPSLTLSIPCNGDPAKDLEHANLLLRKQLEKTAQSLYLFRLESLVNHPAHFFPASQINEWRRSLGQALWEASISFFEPHPRTLPPLNPKALWELKQHIPPAGATPHALMQCKYCIKYELGWCGKESSKEPLWLVNQGKRFRLEFDCGRCEMKVLRK